MPRTLCNDTLLQVRYIQLTMIGADAVRLKVTVIRQEPNSGQSPDCTFSNNLVSWSVG